MTVHYAREVLQNSKITNLCIGLEVLCLIEGPVCIGVVHQTFPVGLTYNKANLPTSDLLLPLLNISPTYLKRQ